LNWGSTSNNNAHLQKQQQQQQQVLLHQQQAQQRAELQSQQWHTDNVRTAQSQPLSSVAVSSVSIQRSAGSDSSAINSNITVEEGGAESVHRMGGSGGGDSSNKMNKTQIKKNQQEEIRKRIVSSVVRIMFLALPLLLIPPFSLSHTRDCLNNDFSRELTVFCLTKKK
jgi:hypothetical protein